MSHISGNGWRVKGFLFLVFLLWVFFSNTFLCYFCANFCAIFVLFLCKFLCDFCAILFIFLCKILSKFLCGSIKGTLVGWDVLSLARLFGATFMEYSNTLLGLDWAREVRARGQILCSGRRAKNRCSMGGYPFEKIGDFLPILFQTSEILQVLFYKIEILFLAYRRWGIKHLQVT